jgi:hypothetical protein
VIRACRHRGHREAMSAACVNAQAGLLRRRPIMVQRLRVSRETFESVIRVSRETVPL